jgi:hypothetical protein
LKDQHCSQVVRDVALIMEAVSGSQTSANFYQTTWYNITEDSHI